MSIFDQFRFSFVFLGLPEIGSYSLYLRLLLVASLLILGYDATGSSNRWRRCVLSDADVCSSVTCMNGGRCESDLRLGFICRCSRDYTGRYCTAHRTTGY